jgi:GNAT superfamily N-acetyltransferase
VGIEISTPVRLSRYHIVEGFDCGYPQLNEWLQRYAWQNQQANVARTFVVCVKSRVVGFYSLAVGAVDHIEAPQRVKKGVARHPIPVMILARLAVDRRYQGMGIGRGLLKDSILRTINASDYAGIRAILVHAKDEKARTFYQKFDFDPSPIDPLQLMLLLKDARRTVEDIKD